jgi:3-isopropylmalate/(R)-2-methylmalate dehydratase small subunit
MEKFTRLTGVAASMPLVDINTDAIIPASYQRTLEGNPGKGLFAGSRYDLHGNEVPDFILNQQPFRESKIIVAGPNFGCGSSREFAVWALMRFGIRSVIAPSFSDIFYENSFKNGLLPIVLPEQDVKVVQEYLVKTNDPTIAIDLERQEITLSDGRSIRFSVPPSRRAALLEGLDEIGQTLRFDKEIGAYQEKQRTSDSWIYHRPRLQRTAEGFAYAQD